MKYLAFSFAAVLLGCPALAQQVPNPVSGPSGTVVPDSVSIFDGSSGRVLKSDVPITELANHVANNDVLAATPTTKFPKGVWRDEYAAGRGALPLYYLPSASACSLNSGDGDSGSQIKSSDGKCWLAQFVGDLNPQQWGCYGDGLPHPPLHPDDTLCLQATINYAASLTSAKGRIALGRNFYCITGVTIPAAIEIRGTSSGVVGINETKSGFKACANNIPLITITGNGVTLANFALNGLGGNTSGYAIKLLGHEHRIENLHINGFCNNIINVGRHNIIDKNVFTDNINPTPSSTCWIIIDGGNDVFPGGDGQTIGSIYSNNMFTAWGPSGGGTYYAAMLFQNSGGYYVFQNDIQRTHYGTMIKPLADKTVAFGLFVNTVLGDTTNADGLLIDTTNANSKVEIVNISNSYISRNGNWSGLTDWTPARNVTIQNSGGGVVAGIHIRTTQMNGASNSNVAWAGNGVTDVTLDGNVICYPGQGTGASPNIALESGASTLAIRNNTIAAACDSTGVYNSSTTTANINFGDNLHNNMLITGNFFAGPYSAGQGPLRDTGGALSNASYNIIKDNWPDGTAQYALASAAIIDPLYYSFIEITGTTTITNIRHPWRGRTLELFMPGGLTFATGGGGTDPICTNLTVASGQMKTAKYIPGWNCWAIN